jgi:hypothetical protein
MNIGVIFIQPILLPPRQQILINQLPAIGNHCDVLEPKVWFVPKLVLCFHLFHHDDVLDADTKGTVFVIARLVRYHVSWGERDFRILDTSSDSDGPFMDIQVRAYAMTCTVAVV